MPSISRAARLFASALVCCALSVALLQAQQMPPSTAVAPPDGLSTGEDLAWPPFLPLLDAEISDPDKAWTAPLAAPMPRDPKITVGRLDNGLHYWIRENSYPEKRAELRLIVRAGSMQEDEDQLGLAHFVEHMAFNGTANFPKLELVHALESFGMRFGADVNASTSFDETVYFLRIPTDDESIRDTAFQMLEDWAHNVTFEDEEIDKERGVVIEEWRLGLGAGARLRDKQFPILFAGSRYAERLPIGKLEVLQHFDHDAARRFYRDWYRPELMAVIAVGDLDRDVIEAKIHEHFERIPATPAGARERVYYAVPPHAETRVSIDTDPEATNSSVVAYHKLPLRRQAYHGSYRQGIVENLYSSMLNRRLAEKAQQPSPPFLRASSSQGIFIPTSEVYILAAATPDGGVARGLEALLTEVERVARFGFTESELQRDKTQFMRGFERIYTEQQRQDSGQFAEEFTRAVLEGESTPGIEYEWALYQRFLPEITLEEVNAAARRWVTERNRVVLVSAPEKAGAELPTEQELLAALDRADDEWIRPYVDTVTDAPLLAVEPEGGELIEETRIEDLGVIEWRMSNGVRVVLKPTEFRQDRIFLRAFSPGGTSLASDDDQVAAESATQVVSASGFGGFSARELTNMLAGKVANVRPFIGSLEEGFFGEGSQQDLETLFQLIYLDFTEPGADPGVFRLIQEQMRASLANNDLNPERAFSEELQRTLTQDHPRRRPFSVELLDEMDLQKSFDFYRDRFADAGDFTFVFVGSFDPETMKPLAVKYLGGLPATGREESWRDEGVRPPRGVVRRAVYKGLEPKSLTTIVFTGAHDFATAQPGALGAMAELLQTRLREVLREDLGGTYGVQVDASAERRPAAQYTVSVSFASDPERAEELSEVVMGEIEKLKGTSPEPRELSSVLEGFRRQHELDIKEDLYWLAQLVDVYRRDGDPHEVLAFEEELAALSAESIRVAAERAFDLGNYVLITLYPEHFREAEEPSR